MLNERIAKDVGPAHLSSASYTLSDMAADAVGLLDALGIDSAHIVGASMGRAIAQTVAIEHPARVRSLTTHLLVCAVLACAAPQPKPAGDCPPIHAGLAQGTNPGPLRAERFDHAPVTTCAGNLLREEFQDLRSWDLRSTAARELYENAVFEPSAVSVGGGKLSITASLGKGGGTGCLDERGGQVTYTPRQFSASDGALFEAVMKPSGSKGVVSAFFAHRIDGDTKNPTTCRNNHEIDMEVIRMASGELRAYFTTWIHARSVWSPCGPSACEPGFNLERWDDRQQESNYLVLGDRFASELHKYGFRWTPQAVEFFIDGEPIVAHRVVVPSGPAPLKVNTWFAQGWACQGKCPCDVSTSGTAEVERICVSKP